MKFDKIHWNKRKPIYPFNFSVSLIWGRFWYWKKFGIEGQNYQLFFDLCIIFCFTFLKLILWIFPCWSWTVRNKGSYSSNKWRKMTMMVLMWCAVWVTVLKKRSNFLRFNIFIPPWISRVFILSKVSFHSSSNTTQHSN